MTLFRKVRTAKGDVVRLAQSDIVAEEPSARSVSGAITIDWRDGTVQTLTLTGNVSGVTWVGFPTDGKVYGLTLYLVQDATGSRTVSFTNVKWPGGAAPTLSTVAASIDVVVLETKDGGATLYGNLAGLAYA